MSDSYSITQKVCDVIKEVLSNEETQNFNYEKVCDSTMN